jgi:hypothetical protein
VAVPRWIVLCAFVSFGAVSDYQIEASICYAPYPETVLNSLQPQAKKAMSLERLESSWVEDDEWAAADVLGLTEAETSPDELRLGLRKLLQLN